VNGYVSESKRDVDVTIAVTEPDGTRTAYIGYEAKMEKSPLDVAEVEQLVTKLNDMSDLTSRAIVSANGFSSTAILKATKRGVRLFEFRDWTEEVQIGFPEMTLVGAPSDCLLFGTSELKWVVPPTALLHLEGPACDKAKLPSWTDDLPMLQADGLPHPDHHNKKLFFDALTRQISQKLSGSPEAQAVRTAPSAYPPNKQPDGPLGDPIDFPDIDCSIENQVFIDSPAGLQRIKSVCLSPVRLQWHCERLPSEYRVLVEVQNQTIHAAVAFASAPLFGDTFFAGVLVPGSTQIMFRPVGLTEKQKNFIHMLKVIL
jgi:hypothetical protein